MKVPLEIKEQEKYTKWLDLHNIMYFAVPNVVPFAGKLKTIQQKVRFWKKRKQEGVKKGVPDLVVFLPDLILFVEMKRIKGSSTSKEQKQWIKNINLFPYTQAIITKGGDEAIDLTDKILRQL